MASPVPASTSGSVPASADNSTAVTPSEADAKKKTYQPQVCIGLTMAYREMCDKSRDQKAGSVVVTTAATAATAMGAATTTTSTETATPPPQRNRSKSPAKRDRSKSPVRVAAVDITTATQEVEKSNEKEKQTKRFDESLPTCVYVKTSDNNIGDTDDVPDESLSFILAYMKLKKRADLTDAKAIKKMDAGVDRVDMGQTLECGYYERDATIPDQRWPRNRWHFNEISHFKDEEENINYISASMCYHYPRGGDCECDVWIEDTSVARS
jgi:hypothetical protein